MAQKNRAQMLIDITSNIFNNVINYITGQNAQDRFVNLLDSSPNIISDKDQANGYVGLDGNGAMFSSYYNENISRADLQTLLTNNLAVGYKFYQINDAVGASKIILVCADSNITLYQFGIDANTGEIGTYDIVTDSFNPIVSTGNANIVYITNAALITLGSTSGISTTTFYVVTDAVAGQLLTKGKTSTTIDDGVLNLDTGESGTYVLATDTFTVSTPDLQQVLDEGNVASGGFRIDDGGGDEVTVAASYVRIENPLGGAATITSSTLDEQVTFDLPDKPAGAETFAMLSDLTGLGGITKATAAGTDTYTTTITGVTGYADGDTYLIRFTNGNTTGATLDINDGTSFLGAKTLYRNNDGAIIGGDIWAGAEMLCVFNSFLNGFQCIGTSPNSLFAYITNDDSVTITKGQVVYAFGGTGDRMTVKLANNQTDATSARTVGVVFSASIAANQKGIIIMQGLIDGLSILGSPFVDGDSVYLGATNGSITRTKPYAPNHLVYVGTVTTASAGSAGRMYVNIQNGYELEELHDVSAQAPADNNTLIYNSSTSLWEAKALKVSDNTNGTAVTGTTANTLSKSLLVKANTLKAGSVVILLARAAKTGNAGTIQLRLYWNTTASLTGAILLATTAAGASSSVFSQMSRWIPVEVANGTGNGTRMFTATTFAATDFGVSTAAISTLALDWTVDSYLICAIQNGAAGDSSVCNVLSIT